jgi:hypothetical protein
VFEREFALHGGIVEGRLPEWLNFYVILLLLLCYCRPYGVRVIL